MGFEYDKSFIQEIEKTIPKQGSTLKVGFLGGTYSEGASVPQVAWWLEFGTKNKDGTQKIAPKYFFSKALIENQAEIESFMEKLQIGIQDGKYDTKTAYGLLGQKIKALIQKQITKQGLIRKKNGGTLRASVSYIIED